MRVLVACEESQAVTIAFRAAGHEAYSCDIKPCSGGHPEWHYERDVFEVINFGWDMMIAHPDCTYLCNSGVCHLDTDPGRWKKLFAAADFFVRLMDADIPKICIENPIPHKYALRLIGRKYDQLIQPYHFGHLEMKATCYWLKRLPPLVNTTDLKYQTSQLPKSESQRIHYMSPGPERATLRSRTFSGVAAEKARQWGTDLNHDLFEGIA